MSPIDTPASASPYAEVRAVEETPVSSISWREFGRVALETGLLTGAEPDQRDMPVNDTLLLAEAGEESPAASTAEEPDAGDGQFAHDSIIDDVNAVRLHLLARRYVQRQLPREHEARLQIATQRVLQLIPSATEEDYMALEQLMQSAAAVRSRTALARQRLAELTSSTANG